MWFGLICNIQYTPNVRYFNRRLHILTTHCYKFDCKFRIPEEFVGNLFYFFKRWKEGVCTSKFKRFKTAQTQFFTIAFNYKILKRWKKQNCINQIFYLAKILNWQCFLLFFLDIIEYFENSKYINGHEILFIFNISLLADSIFLDTDNIFKTPITFFYHAQTIFFRARTYCKCFQCFKNIKSTKKIS